MAEDKYYLYHVRNPETSAGFGNDGYTGITNSPARRFSEHMKAGRIGSHSNHKVQKLYDDANGRLQMHIVREATREEVLASEGLVVNRTNKHANIQRGGGPLRGLSEDELIRRAGLGARNGELQIWRPTSNSVSPQQMALIVAACIGIAGGCYYGYQRYKKVKGLRASSGETSALIGSSGQPLLDDAARQAEFEARKARIEALKKSNRTSTRGFLGTVAAYAALALAAGALTQE